jgi:hypothetical protein
MTPWQVLGVPPGTPRDEAERAYRRRMRRAHPDAGGSSADAVELNRAMAWVRARPPAAAPDRRASPSAPQAAATGRSRRPASDSELDRAKPQTWPISATWLAALLVAVAALVLLVACWELVLLAIATLLVLAILVSALVE